MPEVKISEEESAKLWEQLQVDIAAQMPEVMPMGIHAQEEIEMRAAKHGLCLAIQRERERCARITQEYLDRCIKDSQMVGNSRYAVAVEMFRRCLKVIRGEGI